MKKLSLAEMVMEELDMEELECAIRNAIQECIDYEEIACAIVEELDITRIVRDNIEDLPF